MRVSIKAKLTIHKTLSKKAFLSLLFSIGTINHIVFIYLKNIAQLLTNARYIALFLSSIKVFQLFQQFSNICT